MGPRRSFPFPTLAGALAALLLSIASGCRSAAPAPGLEGLDGVRAEVLAALRAFEAAERELSPDALLAFLSPEFSMLQDGHRVDHDHTVEQIRTTLPTLRSFEPRFDQVEVLVLAPDAAVTSMIFHDVITGADGTVTRMWGPSTLVWRREAGGWRIVFGDSDHYPEAPFAANP